MTTATTNKFNLVNPIPQHRLVTITRTDDGGSVVNVPLILDEEVNIKVSSKYGPLWEGSSNNLMSLLSSSYNIPSGQFALQGLQIWQSTDPIKLSFTVHIEMDTNPLNDVINPTRELMSEVLPTYGNGTKLLNMNVEGAIEKKFNLKLKTLIPPGPNLQTIVNEMSVEKHANAKASNTFNVTMGWVKFKNMIITGVDPKFSKDVCYVNNKPYPISAEVSLELSTIEIATTDMINEMLV